MLSLHQESLQITLTVPLRGVRYDKIFVFCRGEERDEGGEDVYKDGRGGDGDKGGGKGKGEEEAKTNIYYGYLLWIEW